MRIGAELTKLGVPAPARSSFYKMASNFGLTMSRAHSLGGGYLAPNQLVQVTTEFFMANRAAKWSRETAEAKLCDHLAKVFEGRPGLSRESVSARIRESGICAQLQDWAAINDLSQADLIHEASVLEAEGDRSRAALYYQAVASGYEEKRSHPLAAYLQALTGLSRLDPGNPDWGTKLALENKRLGDFTRIAAATVDVQPISREADWKEIKGIIFKIIEDMKHNYHYEPERTLYQCFELLAGLAASEDREQIKSILISTYGFKNRDAKESNALVDAYVRIISPEDIVEIMNALEEGQRGNAALACALVKRLKYREALPKILSRIGKEPRENDYYFTEEIAKIAGREDIPFFIGLLSHPRTQLVEKARETIAALATREDMPALNALLESGNPSMMEAAVMAIGKIGEADDLHRLRPFLELSAGIAIAAAKAILQAAGAEDIPFVEEMAEKHMYLGVRAEAVAALLRLRSPKAFALAMHCALHSNDSSIRNRFQELLIATATAEDIAGFNGEIKSEEQGLIDRIKEKLGIHGPYDARTEYEKLMIGKESKFSACITEEDIASDRWNLRRMLKVPSWTIVNAALQAIHRFLPHGCFNDLAASYRFDGKEDYHATVILDIVRSEDLPEVEKMLSSEKDEIKGLATRIVRRMKAWHLMPQIEVLAAQGFKHAKGIELDFAREYGDWPVVCKYLADENRDVKKLARQYFVDMATRDLLPQIKEMAKSQDEELRIIALHALIKILKGGEPAAEPIKTEEKPRIGLGRKFDEPLPDRQAMIDKLRKMLNDGIQKNLNLYNVLTLLPAFGVELSVQEMNAVLEHALGWTGESYHHFIIRLAAGKKDSAFWPGIKKVFDKNSWNDGQQFIPTIVELFSASDLPMLREMMTGDNWHDRVVAVAALARFGDHSDLELILEKGINKTPDHHDSWVAEIAVDSFAALATREDLPLIRKMLSDINIYRRSAAIKAATRLGLVDLLPLIRARLADNFTVTNSPALDFVVRWGSRGDMPLVRTKLGLAITGVVDAYLHFVTSEDLPEMRRWINSNSIGANYVEAAQRALLKVRDEKMVAEINDPVILAQAGIKEDKARLLSLIPRLISSYRPIDGSIINALISWWDDEDIAVYQPIIENNGTSTGWRSACIRIMADRAPATMLSIARQHVAQFMTGSGLLNSNSQLCLAILEILKDVGDKDDVQMLFAQITHFNDRVRDSATKALAGILQRNG